MSQSVSIPRDSAGGWSAWRERAAAFDRERWLAAGSFVAVVTFALVLNSWSLSRNGLGNTYYAAAVRSMSDSWHNFFFNAFDPGGFITVDKPPVFLWVGALSVRVFGYSSWSLLLPSAVAGAATVALVWLIVRRYFGVLAATVAGVTLAVTPITVAVDRLNLPEPFYILALVAAAWAILHSLESRRWWAWLLAAGFFVGVAFNTKMLAAWIPGPALALAIVAAQTKWQPAWRPLLGRLVLLAAATFVVSAAWMLVVDAWPASDRPYIGGSTDNSVANLAFNYNGLGRVNGDEGAGRGGGGAPPANAGGGATRGGSANPGSSNGGRTAPPGGFNRGGFGTQPGGNVPNGRGGAPFGGANPGGGAPTGGAGAGPGGATGAGGIIAGTPGWLRMFDDANGGQIAWLLPFALLGSVLCLWQWRRDPVRRAATVLFAGWVLLFAGVFSLAQGIYHSYYTSALAPGIAVLVGMSVAAMLALVRQNVRWLIAVAAIVGVTAWVQLTLSGRFPDFRSELRPVTIVAVAFGLAFLGMAALRGRRFTSASMAVIVAGLLLLPTSWATYETANASLNATLPQAGPREGAAGRSFGSAAFDDGTTGLAAWLKAHRDPTTRWDLVVTNAQEASTLIAEDDVSVMALGGFLGTDPTITVNQFAAVVANGEVRYVEVSAGGVLGGRFPNPFTGPNGGVTSGASSQAAGATPVITAVRAACTPITSTDIPAQFRGAVYDCSGKAEGLRAAD